MDKQSKPEIDAKLVNDWLKFTLERLGESIIKKKVGKTGALQKSRMGTIVSGANGPSKIQIDYLYYGKFVDMGVGRGQKLGDVKGNKQLYSAFGVKGGRIAKKWYSPVFYKEFNTLANLIQSKYGDGVMNVVLSEIPEKI